MSRPAFVERERKRVAARSRIGEVVFGVQDGITTTIGIVCSMVAGHQSNAVTLFVGTASACAGMFSMAIGSYLASTAELDVARVELGRERRRIASRPAHEIDELTQIYRSHGMSAVMARNAARRVAADRDRRLVLGRRGNPNRAVRPVRAVPRIPDIPRVGVVTCSGFMRRHDRVRDPMRAKRRHATRSSSAGLCRRRTRGETR